MGDSEATVFASSNDECGASIPLLTSKPPPSLTRQLNLGLTPGKSLNKSGYTQLIDCWSFRNIGR